jgi:hypothetical protein
LTSRASIGRGSRGARVEQLGGLAAGLGRHLGGQRAGDAQIGDVEEGRLFEADVDERRLHAGQHAHDLALVDVAGDALLAAMLDPEVDERRLLEDGHAGLPGRDVDEDLLAHG